MVGEEHRSNGRAGAESHGAPFPVDERLEPRGGRFEHRWRGRQIPVGVLRADVAEVNGERGEPITDYDSLLRPGGEPAHGEAVAQLVQADPRVPAGPRRPSRRANCTNVRARTW